MWKEYSVSYIKRNKASSISIMVAGLVATLFFSMICCLFYNFWRYDIEHIIRDEGDWQGRIAGEIGDADIAAIQNYGNVEKVNVWQDRDGRIVADIYFEDMGKTFQDMPQIVRQAGLLDAEMDRDIEISCHDYLLSQYLIFNPEDEQPPLLLRFFILVMALAAGSLVLVIRNAFAVSMNARIHQLGILSSIGATPRQIKTCLLQEASALCAFPILAGSIGGIGLSIGFIRFMEWTARDMTGRTPVHFQYHPLVFLVTVLASGLTVFLSAWLPARKMGKLTPLQAVQNVQEYGLKKKKQSRLLTAFFGMEGELAGNALKARKPALRTSFISLTFSFLAFSMFLCFMTLSEISVRYTYYEKYKDSWDVMAGILDTGIGEFDEAPELEAVRETEGVDSCVAYQKAPAFARIKEEDFSEELRALGGIGAVSDREAESEAGEVLDTAEESEAGELPGAAEESEAGEVSDTAVQTGSRIWQIGVLLLVLDDEGFAEYCGQAGIRPQMDGGIVVNRIWDSENSNFRYKEYIPFVKESVQELMVDGKEGTAGIKVLAHTEETPVLREEYGDDTLVQVIPASLWRQISGQIGAEAAERDVSLRILASDDAKVYRIEEAVNEILADKYAVETENRIQDEITNSALLDAYRLAVGVLCALLAVIGIANVFSNTLGFLYQRKREFARYLSVGVTPAGIRKILWIEALVIAGKPILVTLPLTMLFAAFAVKASYLDPWEFAAAAPVVPLLLFVVFVFLFVGTAYYIGGRGLLRSDLGGALRDDVMQ